MPQIYHMPKLLNVHLWGMYSNIYDKYEVAPINDVAQNYYIEMTTMRMLMMMTQPNYLY